MTRSPIPSCHAAVLQVEGHIKSAFKVIATETDMCEYNVRWPSRYGCPVDTHVKPASPAAQTNLLILLGIVVAGIFCVVCLQLFRHRATVAMLVPRVMKGDAVALSTFLRVLLPGEDDLVSRKPAVVCNALRRQLQL